MTCGDQPAAFATPSQVLLLSNCVRGVYIQRPETDVLSNKAYARSKYDVIRVASHSVSIHMSRVPLIALKQMQTHSQ